MSKSDRHYTLLQVSSGSTVLPIGTVDPDMHQNFRNLTVDELTDQFKLEVEPHRRKSSGD